MVPRIRYKYDDRDEMLCTEEQCGLDGLLKAQQERIEELEESLELARNYKGIEARPCPLCEYKNGKFIKSCSMHSRINELEAVIKELEEFVKHVSFDSCQCTLKYGLKYPNEHLRDCIVGKAQDYFKDKEE